MPKVYENQDNLAITLDTKLNLVGATETKILYRKPSGATGFWTATVVDGTKVRYTTTEGDIDEAGYWGFQAYAKVGVNQELFGTMATQYFFIPLNVN